MTQKDAAMHWQQGAQEELTAARVLHEGKQYRQALLLCHLAVEKALKATYIREHDDEPPKTHNLVALARRLSSFDWSQEEIDELDELSDFVIDARYADPPWAEETATEARSSVWLERTAQYLSRLSP